VVSHNPKYVDRATENRVYLANPCFDIAGRSLARCVPYKRAPEVHFQYTVSRIRRRVRQQIRQLVRRIGT
jgi:hypothetical protein